MILALLYLLGRDSLSYFSPSHWGQRSHCEMMLIPFCTVDVSLPGGALCDKVTLSKRTLDVFGFLKSLAGSTGCGSETAKVRFNAHVSFCVIIETLVSVAVHLLLVRGEISTVDLVHNYQAHWRWRTTDQPVLLAAATLNPWINPTQHNFTFFYQLNWTWICMLQ